MPKPYVPFFVRFVALVLLGFCPLGAKSSEARELFNTMNMQVWLDTTAMELQDMQHKAQVSTCLSQASKKAFKSTMTRARKFVQKDGKGFLLHALDTLPYKAELLAALQTPSGRKLSDALASKNTSMFSCRFQHFAEYESFWNDAFSLQDMQALTEEIMRLAPSFAKEYGELASRFFDTIGSKELDSMASELAGCAIKFEKCH